jgi:hypothetical protein
MSLRVVILTSNAYHFALPGFAYFWRRFWHEPDAPVTIVGYDALPPPLPANFEFVSLGLQTDFTFSSGLMTYLNSIKDTHLLLALEDYYLDKPVDGHRIRQLMLLIETYSDIGKIDLTDDRLKVGHVPELTYGAFYLPLIRSLPDMPFQMSLQAALWRRDFLLKYLNPDEDAWQMEKQGTRRVINARNQQTEHRVILGCSQPPVTYVNVCRVGTPGFSLKYMPTWMQAELKAKAML